MTLDIGDILVILGVIFAGVGVQLIYGWWHLLILVGVVMIGFGFIVVLYRTR